MASGRSTPDSASARGVGASPKVPVADAPASSRLARVRLQRELSIAAAIRSEHVISYREPEPAAADAAWIQEPFGDTTLEALLAGGPLELSAALRIAVQIARGLVEIHRHDVIHGAIYPGSIRLERATLTVKITNFGAASVLGQNPAVAQSSDAALIPLAYIAPEQTGRTNRKLDHRADFYAFGATLYEMVAGRPPFEIADPLGLVHAQIALSHRSLREVVPQIPEQVAKLVDKLLAKNAEDRYQSARGVLADLETCLEQYVASEKIERFPLARYDVPEKFVISNALYGRKRERARLLEEFGEAAAGSKRLLLVSGYSGVGKSSLVNEVHAAIVARRGAFVLGKFDPLKSHVPYSALAQALNQVCRGLLTRSEPELAAFRLRILEAVQSNVGLMVELAPDLARVLGHVPVLPSTGVVDEQHRFDTTLARLLIALAHEAHPLVLFLDDLQWVDPASLRALSAILRWPEPAHLLIVGAYRDNEVDASHPLAIALTALERAAVPVSTLRLCGLALEDVTALLADTLRVSRAEVSKLAQLVLEKTSGNPFFVGEFLRTLYGSRVLRFAAERGRWTWDLEAVERLGITNNVADLMAQRLGHLPSATLAALRLAACIGHRFGLELVREALGVSALEARALLAPAIRERLLIPLDPSYPLGLIDVTDGDDAEGLDYHFCFLHDRVQQSAYESIPQAERQALHLCLGRALARRATCQCDGQDVFDVVDQLNRADALICDPHERTELAELNLRAGERARRSTAYAEALLYFRRGLAALGQNSWREQYALTLALHLGYAECAYLTGRFDEAGSFSEALLPKLENACERAELYALRIVLEASRGQQLRAIELAREALAALGHPIPELADGVALSEVRKETERLMAGRNVKDLAELPALTEPRLVAVVEILNRVLAPAYWSDRQLFAWLVHENLNLAIRHGLTASTATGLVDFGSYLIAQQRDYPRALAFGRLALALCERGDALQVACHVHVIFGLCANAYAQNHLRTCVPLLERGIELGLQSGRWLYACFAMGALPEIRFMLGDALEDVMSELELRARSVQPLQHAHTQLQHRIWKQGVRSLRGEATSRGSLSTPDLGESVLAAEATAGHGLTQGIYATVRIIVQTLFGETRAAVRNVLTDDGLVERTGAAGIRLTEYGFYASLALVEGLRDPELDARAIAPILEDKRKLLTLWAESAPVNFCHKHLLLEAELAEFEGQTERASRLYDQAIRSAQEHGFHQHAALAAELAGRAFARRGLPEVARAFRQSARAGYLRWGAHGKVRALDEDDPRLAPELGLARRPVPLALDALSVVRASQALSSEMSLPVLLERMLRIIAESSGARKAALLVEREQGLHVEAHLRTQGEQLLISLAGDTPVASVASQAIVRYALRTGEDVVLGHASQRGEFTADPYVLAQCSKSVLCVPMRHRDRVIGALFLENELSSDAFTANRLGIVRLLVAQAAISLENARLYAATQSLNRELGAKEALLRGFLEGMPVGVMVADAAAHIAFHNRAALEITGAQLDPSVTVRELPNKLNAYVVGTNEAYPNERSLLRRALQGETVMVDDLEIRRADRRVQLAAWSTPIRGEDGSVHYAIVAFQDISRQRATEAERTRLAEQLHQAERLEAVGRLSAGVAHDFGNLLTPILAYTELARAQLGAGTRVGQYLTQVHAAAEQAAGLTKQLLAFGRRQAGAPRALDVNLELQSFVRMFRRLVREDIQIELHLAEGLGQIFADSAQLQRIFMNLGMNAVDAMPNGGSLSFETASLSPSPLAAEQGSRDSCLVLRIRDSGQGMDRETLSKIFDPFFTTKEPGKGTGLGLPTVYGVVKQHGGQISVQSAPGHGTTFEVLWPFVTARHEAGGSGARGEIARGPLLAGESILVVDDDHAVREALTTVLQGDGYPVIPAASPSAALDIAREQGDKLALLISDVVMPGMNGLQLFAQLSERNPALGVIFVSGYPGDENAQRQQPLAHTMLAKPVGVDALRAAVREALRRRGGPRQG